MPWACRLGSRFASVLDPAAASNPDVLFGSGPQGWHYRGDLEGHPRQARGGQADVARASLEDPSRLSGQGGPGGPLQALLCWAGRASGAPSQASPGWCPLQAPAGCPSEAKNKEEEQEEAPVQGWACPSFGYGGLCHPTNGNPPYIYIYIYIYICAATKVVDTQGASLATTLAMKLRGSAAAQPFFLADRFGGEAAATKVVDTQGASLATTLAMKLRGSAAAQPFFLTDRFGGEAVGRCTALLLKLLAVGSRGMTFSWSLSSLPFGSGDPSTTLGGGALRRLWRPTPAVSPF